MLQTFLMLALFQQPSISSLNDLTEKKDIRALERLTAGDGTEFQVLKGGAYDVGRFGWKAKPLTMSGVGDFVVFTTPLTSEDIGELVFERVGSKLKLIDEQEKDGLRLVHHKVHVQFNVAKKTASLTDMIMATVTPNEHKFHILRFSPCYQVSSITDGMHPVPFKQTGGIVMIPRQKAGALKLFVTYSGVVDLPNYAGSITPDVITLTNDYWYPMANRMPSTYEIAVVPPGPEWTVVAQGNYKGQEQGVKQPGQCFKMDLPAIYWSLTVLKTKHVAEKFGKWTLQMWSPRVPIDRMKLQPKLYAPIIQFYNDHFSPFPFDSYGALDSPTYGGGALEAYSYATYGGGLPDEDAHEPSHTWWGGILPNTYLKSFWNESFADWSQGFYAREVPIGDTKERRLLFQTVSMPQEDYNAAPLMKSGASIGAAAGSLGYGKGALVLSMLEQIVGSDNLVACMQAWIAEHPKGEPAEWEEFEGVVLKKLPQFKLKNFFDDWFRRPGFANVQLVGGSVDHAGFHGRLAWTGSTFRMPIELWFEDRQGSRTSRTLDTGTVAADGSFTLAGVSDSVVRVYLDPYHRALRTGDAPQFESFDELAPRFKVVRDSNHSEYLQSFGVSGAKAGLDDLANKFLIGHPDTMTQLKPLCESAGFHVDGNKLTFEGTTIDLRQGAAVAVIELGNGKRCAIGLGVCKMRPNIGAGYVGLVDDLGRALRGKVRFPESPSQALTIHAK